MLRGRLFLGRRRRRRQQQTVEGGVRARVAAVRAHLGLLGRRQRRTVQPICDQVVAGGGDHLPLVLVAIGGPVLQEIVAHFWGENRTARRGPCKLPETVGEFLVLSLPSLPILLGKGASDVTVSIFHVVLEFGPRWFN